MNLTMAFALKTMPVIPFKKITAYASLKINSEGEICSSFVLTLGALKKLFAIPFSITYYLFFGLILGVFHPVQVVCFHLGGYNAHRWSVIILNKLLILDLLILGSRSMFFGFEKLPKGHPLIIVANHQNLLDISPIVWGFRHFHPKFISKKELGKGIPSISYNLKKGGSLLIDRKKGSQSVKQIFEYGRKMNELKYSVVLYPEGTRSKTGQIQPFKVGGLKALMSSMPDAYIVPFVIDNNYKVTRSGAFPLEMGHTLSYTVLDPIKPGDETAEDLSGTLEEMFKKQLRQ